MTDPWEHLLASDEEIVWQGAPSPKVRLEWDSPFMPVFYLFFVGFSVFWMLGASAGGGYIWTFGLLFFGIGVYGLIGVHFSKAYVRSKKHYTLTNQRAMIGTAMFGRKTLKSYPISRATPIDYEDAVLTGDIYFATKETRSKNGVTVTRIGFEQIKDHREVMSLIRQVQAGGVSAGTPSEE